MADLHWFPFFVQDWLASPAVQEMLPEQEGAYLRLLCIAWGGGRTLPCLPNDDDVLARMSRLGRKWKKLGPLIKAQFDVQGDLLVNERLAAVWHEQQERYTRRSAAGKRSGKARAMRKQSSNNVPPPFEHAPMVMDLDSQKDYRSRGAGAAFEGGPAPASSGPQDVRQGEGPTPLGAILAGLIPRPA